MPNERIRVVVPVIFDLYLDAENLPNGGTAEEIASIESELDLVRDMYREFKHPKYGNVRVLVCYDEFLPNTRIPMDSELCTLIDCYPTETLQQLVADRQDCKLVGMVPFKLHGSVGGSQYTAIVYGRSLEHAERILAKREYDYIHNLPVAMSDEVHEGDVVLEA